VRNSATGSAIARVVYVTEAYRTGDILYYSVSINLWAIAEQTFGYLVIGVPAIPKAFQNFSFAKHIFGSFARSRCKSRQGPSNPSGYIERISSPRGYRDPWEVGDDADTHVLMTIVGDGKDDVALPHPAQLRRHDDSREGLGEDAVGMAVTSP
jgi:hypothetical protein